MRDDQARDFILKQLEFARAAGLEQPVLLLLAYRSPHARALFDAMLGRPMGPPPPGLGELAGHAVLVPGEAARRLLRRCAGTGGDYVARTFAQLPSMDIWVVGLLPEDISFAAIVGGAPAFSGAIPYEFAGRRPETLLECMTGDGPTVLRLVSDGGVVTPVCGPSGPDASLAALLVSVVCTRRIEYPESKGGFSVPVDDDKLADMLLRVYSDRPAAVAEAIMALRKKRRRKAAELRKVLRGRPELRELARQVDRHLAGE
jgi:hypothetical protein